MHIALLPTITFGLALAAAAPSPLPSGTSISISKNARRANDNGCADIPSLLRDLIFAVSYDAFHHLLCQQCADRCILADRKYNGTLQAMVQNSLSVDDKGGRVGAEAIVDLAASQGRISPVPLTDDSGTLWHGSISVGTPPVSYTGKHCLFRSDEQVSWLTSGPVPSRF
jgi:hypothetical protein